MRLTIRLAIVVSAAFAWAGGAFAHTLARPAEAVAIMVRFCIETGGRAERLEAAIASLTLPAAAVATESRNGVTRTRLHVDGAHVLTLVYEPGGFVGMCSYYAQIDDVPATFERARRRLGVAGNLDYYLSGSAGPEPVAAPGGSELRAMLFMAMGDDETGSITLTVAHATGTN